MVRKTSEIRFKIRSEKYFQKIFEEYYRPLFFYAKGFVNDEASADDIVQECFYKLWENKDSLEILSISGLLYADVRNRCLNFLKHEKTKEKHVLYEKSKHVEHIDSMIPLYEEELMRQITKLIAHLPAQQKDALMFRVSGDSIPDISKKMGISVNTVKTHLLKARNFLRIRLRNTLLITLFVKF